MLIELQSISKYYENAGGVKRHVLQDVSFSVNSGDSIAIVGPSGSGKSTLLNIMGTLDTPSQGQVTINGMEIHSLKEEQLAGIRNRNIGFVFQMHYLLPQLSVLENVLVPVIPQKDKKKHKATQSRAIGLLERVGMSDKIHQLPGQLSVGECQRTAVVRALINEPELLLADEPTGSLDHDSATHLADLLLQLKSDFNLAIVTVTHSSELANRMQTVYTIVNGRLQGFEPHS